MLGETKSMCIGKIENGKIINQPETGYIRYYIGSDDGITSKICKKLYVYPKKYAEIICNSTEEDLKKMCPDLEFNDSSVCALTKKENDTLNKENFLSIISDRSNYPYYGQNRDKYSNEWDIMRTATIPSQTQTFYLLFIGDKKPPSYWRFLECYINNNKEYIKICGINLEDIDSPKTLEINFDGDKNIVTYRAFNTRLLLSYASFMRQIDAYYKCLDSKRFDGLRMGYDADYYGKFDLEYVYHGNKYHVDLKTFNNYKQNNNNDVCSIYLDANNHDTCGNFWLFSQDVLVNRLIEYAEEKENGGKKYE